MLISVTAVYILHVWVSPRVRRYNVHIKSENNCLSNIQTPPSSEILHAWFLNMQQFFLEFLLMRGGEERKEGRKIRNLSWVNTHKTDVCMTVLDIHIIHIIYIMYLLTLGPTHACNMYTVVKNIADIYTQVWVCNMW